MEHFGPDYCYDRKLIEFIAEKTNVEKFDFIIHPIWGVYPQFTHKCVHFKKVKDFTCYAFDGNSFPFTFDHLEELRLYADSNRLINDIIKQNGKLVKLFLRIRRANISDFLSEEWAKLLVFSFEEYYHKNRWENRKKNIDAVAKLLNEKYSAESIEFVCDREFNREYLEGKIERKKWNLNHIGNVEKERATVLQLIKKIK